MAICEFVTTGSQKCGSLRTAVAFIALVGTALSIVPSAAHAGDGSTTQPVTAPADSSLKVIDLTSGAPAAEAPPAPLATKAEPRTYDITVTEALMELHTGAGRGYPIFYAAERGESVRVLMRRTDWFLVRNQRGAEGWVSREQMEANLAGNQVPLAIHDAVLTDYLHKRLEVGFAGGRFNGDPVISFRTSYQITPNVLAEVNLEQISGTYSGSQIFAANLQIQPYTETRYLPYLTIGTGIFENRNRATLVGSDSSITSSIANAGLGMRVYLTRSFLLRLDYRQHVSLTSTTQHDRFDEELIGLSFFFQ